ncbi:MAG: hypothetical protein E7523_08305 [Ruminococcaceae bacterium]|nr:hypothetical protein [Oscillospiraceae bacterium]
MAQVEGSTANRDRTKKEKEEFYAAQNTSKDLADVIKDTYNGMVDIVDSMGAATGVTKEGDWDKYKYSSGSSSSSSGSSSSKKTTTSTPSTSGKSVNMWENLATGMKNTVTTLMDVATAQKTAELRGEDEKTIYEKIMSGDQTYIQYYDIKTGGLLSDVSAVVSYAGSEDADLASADTYSVVKDVIARVNKNGAILGASTTQSLLDSLTTVLEQTSGFEAERTAQMWTDDADALIDWYASVQEKLESGDAAALVNYLRTVSGVVNSANTAAEYVQFMDADERQAYIDGVADRQQALIDIYNSIDINPLNDTQLQELLQQKEDLEAQRSAYTDPDGTAIDLPPMAQLLDNLGLVDLVDNEDVLDGILSSLQTVNTAIDKRLSALGFSNATNKELYEAYENNTLTEFAQNHPILASGVTVVANLGAALSVGDTIASGFGYSDSGAYEMQKISNVWRSTAAQEFSEWYHEHPTVVSEIVDKGLGFIDVEDSGEWLYNVLMAGADDLARTGVSSVLTLGVGGGSKKVMKALSTLLASSSAMSSQFVNEIENGASAGDALLSSFIGAVAEGASEYISLDLLLKDGGGNILKTVIKSAFTEGTEEVAGQIFENILDLAILQDESDLVRRWNELKDEGNSNTETLKTILIEEAKEAGSNFLSGALSAGGTAIGTAPVTQAKTNAQNRAYGKAIIAAEAVPVLLEEAQSVPGVSAELRKTVSDQMNAEKPGKSYAKNVGQLYGEYSTAATQQAAEARLMQMGFNENKASVAAEAIVKDMQGKDLTKEQKTALKDDSVKQVHRELQEKNAGWYMQLNNRLGQVFVRQTADTATVQAEEKAEHTEPVVFSADGVAISPQGVTQTADGEQQIVVDKASGATMDVQDLQPTDERSAAVQAVLAGDSIGALGKDVLLGTLEQDGDSGNIEMWLAGYEEYYKAGLQGFNSASAFEHAVGTDDIGAYLTADQKEVALLAGLKERNYTNGVTWITSGNVHVSETQETEAKILDAIGKEYGLAFVLTDNLDGVNGLYGKGTQSNRIVLSLDAEGGILTAAAGHEVFHYLKENAPDAANSLQKFVLQRLYSTKGFDINAELEKYSTRYALEIDGMTETEQRQYLLEELTADSMFGVFASKKAVELYARKQPKDAKKVAKAINNFLAKVRSALETLAFKGLGSVSALQQQYDTLDEISNQFFAALEEARINRQQNKNTAVNNDSETRLSKKVDKENKPRYNKKSSYNEQMTLYMQWSESQSTPLGEKKVFKLYKNGQHHLYEKTEEGAVDLGVVKKTGKRSGAYETANRKRIDKTYEHDGSSGHSGGRSDGSDRLGGLRSAHEGSDGDLPSARLQDDDTRMDGRDIESRDEIFGYELRRNSARITSETESHNEILRESDVKFAEAEEALGEAVQEIQTEQGGNLNGEMIENLAQTAAEKLQSKYDAEQFKKAFTDVFSYLSQGGNIKTAVDVLSDFYLKALNTSRSEKIDFSLQDAVKETIRDLRKNPVVLTENQIAAIKKVYGDYANFHKASFGKILFKKEGNAPTLAERWADIAKANPDFLDPQTAEADQPQALLDFYEATRPYWYSKDNPFGATALELDTAALHMTMQTLLDYLQATRPTAATDTYKTKLDEYFSNSDADEFSAAMALAEKTRDKSLQYYKRLTIQRKRRETYENKNNLRKSIRRNAKRLADLLVNETDQKHIPEKLKAQISTFLELFYKDDTTFSESKLLALQAAYNEYGKDEELGTMFDEDIANKIGEMREALHGKRLTALNNSELQALKELTQHFTKIVRDGNKAFYLGKRVRLDEIGTEAVVTYTREKPAQQIKMLKAAESLLHTNMLTPNSFFDLLQGPLAKCYEQLLFHDQNIFGRYILHGTNFLQAQKKKYGYNEWKDKKLTFVSADGDEINLTADEVCMLWATWKREHTSAQQARHLEEGGIVFKDELGRKGKRGIKDRLFEVRDGSAHRLSVQDMEIISEFMTDEMQAFTDELVGFLSKDASEWGNAVSMEKYGIKKFTEKYYIPFNTASNYNFRKFGTDIENGTNRLMNRSWTKHTVKGANTPIIVDNLTDVWSGHVAEMAQYSAFALTLDGMEQIFNYRTQVNGQVSRVSSLISTYYGQKYMDYFTTFMTDLNGKNYTDPRDDLFTKYIRNYKKAAVSMSLRVTVQQPTSYFRAFQELGFTSMFVLPGTKKTYEEMLEYAPGVTLIKEVGGFDSLVGKSMAGYIGQEHYTGKAVFRNLRSNKQYRKDAFDNAAGLMPSKMDRIAWQSIWKATKKQVAKETKLTGGALLTVTGKRFTKIINDTQVYGSVLAQSHAMRSKSPMMKILTAFMAEPTVNYNMLLRLGRELTKIKGASNKDKKKHFVRAASIGLGLLISSIAQEVLKAAVTYDDDEEKSRIEVGLQNIISGLLGNLPFNWIVGLRDVITLLQGYSLDREEFSVITDMLDAIGDLFNGDMSAEDKAQSIVSAITALAGYPIGNAWRDVEMMLRTIAALFDDEEDAFETTATTIEYSLREKFSFWSSSLLNDMGITYDSSTEKYFERAFEALQKGDVQTYNDTLDYIRRKSTIDEDDIQNGIANQIALFSEDAFFGALSLMVGDLDSHGEMVDALIDLGIEEDTAVKGIEKVEANYKEMLEDAAKEELNGKTAQRDSVLAQLTDVLGDADSIEDLYSYTLEDVRNAPEEDDETLRVTASDIGTAVLNGRVDTTAEAIAYLREHDKSDSDIRSGVTKKVKDAYLAAYDADDYDRMSQIIDDLFALGIGYDSSDFEDWEKKHTSDRFDADYGDELSGIVSARMNRDFAAYEAGVQALLDSDYEQDAVFSALNSAMADNGYTQKPETGYLYWYGDIKYALRDNDTKSANRMIDYMIEHGKEEGDIKSAITTEFKPDYVEAITSGDYATADRIASLLFTTGLYEQKTLDKWVKDAQEN